MISQPRIAVLGMSKLYVFIEHDDSVLVVVVLVFELTYNSSCSLNPAWNCI